jgi:hypothetical protein
MPSVNFRKLDQTIFSVKSLVKVKEVSLSFAVWEDFFNLKKKYQDLVHLEWHNVCKVSSVCILDIYHYSLVFL